MSYPVFCRNCKHSAPDPDSTWQLRCHEPSVNGKDGWALASCTLSRGTDCHSERKVRWFAVCGMKGKKYEAKK